MTCISTPVSWLKLEQYQLKELSPREMKDISVHLASCPTCAACAESIAEDARVLPPLPEPEEKTSIFTLPRFAYAMAACGAALLLALFFSEMMPIDEPSGDHYTQTMGEGDTTLTIARERDGTVVENPTVYLSGDRFRLFATVGGNEAKAWDVAVFQGTEVFFPLTPEDPLFAGNRMSLPGAFRITGDEAVDICLIVGETIPQRDALRREGKNALPESAVCSTIEPAREDR